MNKSFSALLLLFHFCAGCGEAQMQPASDPSITQWKWPDSLDALIAAGDYHKLLFEDSTMRVLEVTVGPGQLDPIHTHKGHSVVWVTHASPILYRTYDNGENGELKLVKTDTIIVKPDELNIGMREAPEGPHSVENIGTAIFRLYRNEYKSQQKQAIEARSRVLNAVHFLLFRPMVPTIVLNIKNAE